MTINIPINLVHHYNQYCSLECPTAGVTPTLTIVEVTPTSTPTPTQPNMTVTPTTKVTEPIGTP